MSFNSNSTTEDADGDSWLKPREAAVYANVSLRAIYTWIKDGEIVFEGEKRSTKISQASLDRKLGSRNNSAIANEVLHNSTSKPKREATNTLTLALAGLQNERQQLLSQVAELQAQAVKAARILGQLEAKANRVEVLESEIARLRTSNTRALVIAALIILLLLVILLLLLLLK